MDNTFVPQVSVYPDDSEKKAIRLHYNKVAVVLLVNILIFNGLGIGGRVVIDAVFGADIWTEFSATVFSCAVPIISETIAIILGIGMLKLDFRPMLTRKGFTGGTVAKLLTLSIGLQTAAAYIAALIAALLGLFGLEGRTADLSATTSLPANLIMYFYACLLGPVLEELLYRGVLLQSMRKYNERFAIFLSAAIFGLMHQNYQQAILGFLVGIPLAVVTIKSGSIVPAIFTHIMLNTLGTVFNCWIQYTCPEMFEIAASGDVNSMMDVLTAEAMIAILTTFVFRMGFMIAALVVGIVVLVKGGNMTRPTLAGKTRTMPIFITAVCWWIVLTGYAFLNLVYPFMQ